MENDPDKGRQIVESFLDRGLLLSPDVLPEISDDIDWQEKEMIVINRDILSAKKRKPDAVLSVNWRDMENARVQLEKAKDFQFYKVFVNYLSAAGEPGGEVKGRASDVEIISSYDLRLRKWALQDFVNLFLARFKVIRNILLQHQELQEAVSIKRVNLKESSRISCIGMVTSKSETKNKNLQIEIEDQTDTLRLTVTKDKTEVYTKARDIVLDEVIGATGVKKGNAFFVTDIFFPDIPSQLELKRYPEEAYMAVISDLHIGSKNFLGDEFAKFIRWIRMELGDEANRIVASRTKVIFIIGDLVDGVGIYPEQESELSITDIYEQYEVCAHYLSQIPSHIQIVIIPGNHDSLRLSEPQPALPRDIAAPIYRLPNTQILSNPSTVRILKSEKFPGFDVLLYHGYSFIYYAGNVESIRSSGGVDHADRIMKFLLQRRHLAPTYTSTLYVPNPEFDPLVIETVPDFFLSGHLHKTSASNYNNTTMICGSCWQSMTSFEEKQGLHPEPARVPVVNLQTREMKILKFGP